MIIATAGHVDHGKTGLVRALTGVDTDRLPEEKRRGLTIDLGFAYLPAGDGLTLGFVDVPGHERFVRNMLAGVTGIDLALLVVAADDGPMPQTREHVAILDLLGVDGGAVAITKTDRVEAARVAEVMAEVRALLGATTLANAEIFAVSAPTGVGMGALRDGLLALARERAPRRARGNFRMAVDRSFHLRGAGLVATGTAAAGRIAPGDRLRAVVAGQTFRARSLHVQNAPAAAGRAGERCAINLAGGDSPHAQVERGDWIVAPDAPDAVAKLDVRVRVLADEPRALSHWTPVHVHIGAADVTARVALLQADAIAPGGDGLAQLVLSRPVGAVHGDRLILRDQSSRRTVGGGRVIDIFPPARGRAKPERLAWLAAMESDDDAGALAALLALSAHGVDLRRFADNRNLTPAEREALFAATPMHAVGGLGFAAHRWQALRDAVLTALAAWHQRLPDSPGIAPDRVLHGTAWRVPPAVCEALVNELAREGALVRGGAGVRLASHAPCLAQADEALWRRIAPHLETRKRLPPTLRETAEAAGLPPERVEALLERAARHGLVHRISPLRFVLPSVLRGYAELVRELATHGGDGRVGTKAFRDRSGIGRNLAIEVLEYFDAIGLTHRTDDARELLRDPAEVFPGPPPAGG